MTAARSHCDWQPHEDAELHMLAFRPVRTVARRLGRTVLAVHCRLAVLGMNLNTMRRQTGGLTVADVARGLGARERTVYGWIAHGWLAATRLTVGGRSWQSVDVDAVCSFLDERGALFPLQPDGFWRSIVRECRAELETRLIVGRRLVALLGYTDGTALTYLRRRRAFPEPVLRLGNRHGGDYYDRAAVRGWLEATSQYWTRQAKEQL